MCLGLQTKQKKKNFCKIKIFSKVLAENGLPLPNAKLEVPKTNAEGICIGTPFYTDLWETKLGPNVEGHLSQT
jgi:hypothetical protein